MISINDRECISFQITMPRSGMWSANARIVAKSSPLSGAAKTSGNLEFSGIISRFDSHDAIDMYTLTPVSIKKEIAARNFYASSRFIFSEVARMIGTTLDASSKFDDIPSVRFTVQATDSPHVVLADLASAFGIIWRFSDDGKLVVMKPSFDVSKPYDAPIRPLSEPTIGTRMCGVDNFKLRPFHSVGGADLSCVTYQFDTNQTRVWLGFRG